MMLGPRLSPVASQAMLEAERSRVEVELGGDYDSGDFTGIPGSKSS